MGRFVKNKELRSASYSIRAPYGVSALGPNDPPNGMFRLNADNKKLEVFSESAWRTFAIEGDVTITKDEFVGNAVDDEFGPMTKSYAAGEEAKMLVYIGNVFQNPGVAFTVDGDMITFTSTPNNLQTIVILHGYASTVVTI